MPKNASKAEEQASTNKKLAIQILDEVKELSKSTPVIFHKLNSAYSVMRSDQSIIYALPGTITGPIQVEPYLRIVKPNNDFTDLRVPEAKDVLEFLRNRFNQGSHWTRWKNSHSDLIIGSWYPVKTVLGMFDDEEGEFVPGDGGPNELIGYYGHPTNNDIPINNNSVELDL